MGLYDSSIKSRADPTFMLDKKSNATSVVEVEDDDEPATKKSRADKH